MCVCVCVTVCVYSVRNVVTFTGVYITVKPARLFYIPPSLVSRRTDPILAVIIKNGGESRVCATRDYF